MAAGGHLGLLKKHLKSRISLFVGINQSNYGFNDLRLTNGVKLKSQAQNLGKDYLKPNTSVKLKT